MDSETHGIRLRMNAEGLESGDGQSDDLHILKAEDVLAVNDDIMTAQISHAQTTSRRL